MRKCEVILEKGAKPVPAKFHMWYTEAYVLAPSIMISGAPGGQVINTMALIELENGWCKLVYPTDVHFLDTNEKKLVVKTVDDPDKVLQVTTMLKNNDGYCPCRMQHTPDTKCMCKQFREQIEPGTCHCGLYEKVYKED